MNIRKMTAEEAGRLIPRLKPDANKGEAGKVLVVAGSPGMAGAAVLAVRGAYRAGAGLVKLAARAEVINIAQCAVPEATACIIDGSAEETKWKILEESRGFHSMVLGPGLGRSPEATELAEFLVENAKIPMVLDADGINIIAEKPELLKRAKADIVMTPHPGEMSRLTGRSIKEINSKRQEEASEFAISYGVSLVLKGAETVIASPTGELWINTTGNPGMATAGSGDVLSGITGAYLSHMSADKAARLAVYVHGLAGDICRDRLGVPGTMAGDIAFYTAEAGRRILE